MQSRETGNQSRMCRPRNTGDSESQNIQEHSRRCGGWRASDKRTRGGRSKLLTKWRSTGFTPGCGDAALLPQRTGLFPGGGRDQGLWPRVTDSMRVWLKQTLRIPPPATMLPPLSSRLSPQASPHPSRLKTKVTDQPKKKDGKSCTQVTCRNTHKRNLRQVPEAMHHELEGT